MAYTDFEIIKTLVVFPPERNGIWHKELNLISWNGKMPKYDLRSWTENHEQMTKGITLTKEQMKEVAIVIMSDYGYKVDGDGE